MQQIEHTYCDLVRQSIRIKGVIMIYIQINII
jgi:hypothetical protein